MIGSRKSKTVLYTLLFLAVGALALFLLRGVFFRQMLYPAPDFPVPAPPEGLEEIYLPLGEGASAHGWFHQEPGADIALVILHGNGENLGTMAFGGLFETFEELDVSFLALDYPGYGQSQGRSSRASAVAATTAALEWMGQKNPDAKIVLWGWSLGAAVALQAAPEAPRLDGLALFSPWSSLAAVAQEHFPAWLVRLGLLERYNSLAAAGRIHCPTLVIHGRLDRIIPAHHGAEVASRLTARHRFQEIPEAGHNDLLAHPRVWEELKRFLESLRGD